MTTAQLLTVSQRDTLRRAAFTSAAKLMREAASEFELQASDPSQVGMEDAKTSARFVRDELDALDALGWVDEAMAAQAESKNAESRRGEA